MNNLLRKLETDFSDITFVPGKEFCWSPKHLTITFVKSSLITKTGAWSLLHEVAHAALNHKSYNSDIELLHFEAAAWQKAKAIGKDYGCVISEDHIEDCLDTYREWLHQRSACPSCSTRSLQQNSHTYQCFNCQTSWRVTSSRFCRPYRKLIPTHK